MSDAEHLGAAQRVELAKADLERARAQSQLASVMVGNGVLTAPFAGLVTRVPDGIGRIVGPGEPLFHVEDTSVLKLERNDVRGRCAARRDEGRPRSTAPRPARESSRPSSDRSTRKRAGSR